MAIVASDMWQDLQGGDRDPFSTGNQAAWCNRTTYVRSKTFYCTRPTQHEGVHVACYTNYVGPHLVCCESWPRVPAEMRLPEGF